MSYLSQETIKRMEGLSKIKDNESIIVSSMSIRDSLREEGFDDQEIKLYLWNKINDLF